MNLEQCVPDSQVIAYSGNAVVSVHIGLRLTGVFALKSMEGVFALKLMEMHKLKSHLW